MVLMEEFLHPSGMQDSAGGNEAGPDPGPSHHPPVDARYIVTAPLNWAMYKDVLRHARTIDQAEWLYLKTI